jgi:MFS superfamily sulfate permease-like transporter
MGLYTIVPPLIAYALLGTSRLLVVGPDTATGLISALTVGAIAIQGTAEWASLRLGYKNGGSREYPLESRMPSGRQDSSAATLPPEAWSW